MTDQYHANLDRPGILNEDLDAHIADNILNKAQDLGVYVPNDMQNDLRYLLQTTTRNLHTELTPIVTSEMAGNRAELINGTDYTMQDYNNEIAREVESRINDLEYVLARSIYNIARSGEPLVDRGGDQRFTLTQRGLVDVQTVLLGFTYTMANPQDSALNDILFSTEGLEALQPETLARLYDSISQNGNSIIQSIQFLNASAINQVYADLPPELRGSVQILTILKLLNQDQQAVLVSHILSDLDANPAKAQAALQMLTQNNFVSGALVSAKIEEKVALVYDQPLTSEQQAAAITRLRSLNNLLTQPNPEYQASLEQALQDTVVSLGIASHDAGNPALSGSKWLEFGAFYGSLISGVLGGAVCLGSGAGMQALFQYLPNAIIAKSAYEGMQGNGYIDWISRMGNGFNLNREQREARDITEWRDIAYRETLTGNLEQTKFFASDTVIGILGQSIDLTQEDPNFSFTQFERRLQNNPALYQHYQTNIKNQYQGNLDSLKSKITLIAYTFHYLQVDDLSYYIDNVAKYRNFTADNIPNLG